MRVEGIAATFPRRVVTNDDVLALIAEQSGDCNEADPRGTRALRRVRRLLTHSGIEARRWSSPDETPIQMLAQAIARAAAQGGASLSDVDLLIYTGVGGGFSEPGNSYMVAHALGMRQAQCFDIRDACNSWCRALQIVHHAFQADRSIRRALVVNAEFNMYWGGPGVPDLFRLRDPSEVDSRFPAYTIGEAATATFLVNDPNNEWEFHFSSRTDLADLCVIPEVNYKGYCAMGLTGHGEVSTERIGRNGPHRFTSFASALSAAAPEALEVFRKLTVPRDSIRRIFPHASSKRDWDNGADVLGVRDRLFHIYPEYGNVVSASVPAGLALALEKGEIERGDRLATWVGSAGMSFSACSFVL
jgi:acyl-CoA:acyl-CoA alkyltransferase